VHHLLSEELVPSIVKGRNISKFHEDLLIARHIGRSAVGRILGATYKAGYISTYYAAETSSYYLLRDWAITRETDCCTPPTFPTTGAFGTVSAKHVSSRTKNIHSPVFSPCSCDF
jgi:hypothetical protein